MMLLLERKGYYSLLLLLLQTCAVVVVVIVLVYDESGGDNCIDDLLLPQIGSNKAYSISKSGTILQASNPNGITVSINITTDRGIA